MSTNMKYQIKEQVVGSNELMSQMIQSQQADKMFRFLDGKAMARQYETKVSKEIRILAEVEKVWILFDIDQNGTLDR